MDTFRLILVDPNYKVCAAWREVFGNFPSVEIVRGYFEELPEFDCMVSAANSFGLMDGGVDAAILRFFGTRLQHWVQSHILEEYLGEQSVGTSFIIETANPKHPFIAHTPTMRVPMEIARSDNVYRAMWAMLLAVRRHNREGKPRINIVACPGLGTATGKVPAREAARQMSLAYNNFLNPPSKITWDLAHERQFGVLYGSDMDHRLPPLE